MRVKVLQVVFHNKEPVFSLDFHSSGVLATAGTDGEIKLWSLANAASEAVGVTFLASVTGDSFDTGFKAWNVVRFCPIGHGLAAAGDNGQVYHFRPQAQAADLCCEDLGSSWKAVNCGAFSGAEVVDLCWAADGSGFVTASHDMSCMFWDPFAKQRKARLRLEGHRLYVQGVAWDPLHQYIVSQAADRTCRVFSIGASVPGLAKRPPSATKQAIDRLEGMHCCNVINKAASQPSTTIEPEADADRKAVRKHAGRHLFLDETAQTFFRRLSWSPDGSLLAAPAGISKQGEPGSTLYMTYIFARGSWNAPLIQLPSSPKPTVAARFCPVLFDLEETDGDAPLLPIELPYRMVFAVASKDTVTLYDTQAVLPLAVLVGLHLEQITDLAWSPDGLALAISSYDGYCSVACFEAGELGRPVDFSKVPEHIRSVLRNTAGGRGQWTASPEASKLQRGEPGSITKDELERKETSLGVQNSQKGEVKPLAATVEIAKRQHEGSPPGLVGFKRVRRISPVAVPPVAKKPLQPVTAAALEEKATATQAETKRLEVLSALPQQVGLAGEERAQRTPQRDEGPSIADLAAAAGRAAAFLASESKD